MDFRLVFVASVLGLTLACDRKGSDGDSGTPDATATGNVTGTGTGAGPGSGSGSGTGNATGTGTGATGPGTGSGTGTGATGTGTGACGVPTELGPWGGDFAHPLEGATITTDAYTSGTGIADVLAAYDAGTYDVSGSPIVVTGAAVINMGFRSDFGDLWLEDSTGAIRTFITSGAITDQIAPGDVLSFEVTTIGDWFGEPQITAIQNYSRVSAGGPVRVRSGIGVPLDWDANGPTNFEVYGEIAEVIGDCEGGTKICYNLAHGGIQTEMSLSPSNYTFYPGDCVHIIAPLAVNDGTPRYILNNWDWWTFIR